MWMINCLLLILGTVAAVMGISFYIRNRAAAGNLRLFIFFYGICAAVWCTCYGIIGISDNLALCEWIRRIGVLAIDAFLVTEVYLVSEMSGAKRIVIRCARIAAILASVVDFIVYSGRKVDLFVREGAWTTWYANPAYAAARKTHSLYLAMIFVILTSFGVAWIRHSKQKRLRWFFFMVFFSNFIMLFFTIPDTYLPAMGQHAVSTSGIGGALCAIVMWYGAIRLNAFDIRMGYVKDRLFDFVEAGIIVFDVDRSIAMLNRFSKKLADEMSEAPRGLNDFFLISRAVAQEMFLRAESGLYATRLTDRAGVKSYSVRITAMRDNFGEIFCYMCVFSDVTEEVEFAAKFSVASRAKSRFLAQMSHEIRTPINAVLGMNEMILREAADPEILEYASNIDAAGNTLLSLINSILDFSKIEDGKMEIIPVQYDTASFIHDLVNSIIQRADAKGLALDVKVDENLPCAMIGDDVRFSQIIMNLLTNAVKYTPKGTVTFTIRVEEKKADTVRLFVSVKDTGMGIKKEDLGKLYESFERLDEIKNHNIEGTGLGISIVTSLLELMGSRLEVESTYGEGSRFWFTVEQQIADDTPIGDYEKRLKESRRGREKDQLICAPGARVLLVDDNEMNLKVAKNLLKLCGIEPDMVLSGQQTIEAMRKKTYDIVFLDHMMPGMDGVETLAVLLKEDLVPKETTMIALTANAVVGARERYLAAGFADYLSKPIEVKELEEKLKEYLPGEAYRTEALPAAADQAPDVPGEAIARQGGVYAQSVDAGGAEVFEFAPADAAGGADGVIGFTAADTAGRTGTVTATGPADEGVRYDIDRLAQLGIDTDTGMSYCASDESIYFETLGDYTVACEEKAAMMGALFDAKNWKEYGVMVHAAKSNSKMIGATELSKQALALEEAATRGDVSCIKEHHEDFLEAYRRMGEGIRGAAAG